MASLSVCVFIEGTQNVDVLEMTSMDSVRTVKLELQTIYNVRPRDIQIFADGVELLGGSLAEFGLHPPMARVTARFLRGLPQQLRAPQSSHVICEECVRGVCFTHQGGKGNKGGDKGGGKGNQGGDKGGGKGLGKAKGKGEEPLDTVEGQYMEMLGGGRHRFEGLG
jgi:hypothetical protein